MDENAAEDEEEESVEDVDLWLEVDDLREFSKDVSKESMVESSLDCTTLISLTDGVLTAGAPVGVLLRVFSAAT